MYCVCVHLQERRAADTAESEAGAADGRGARVAECALVPPTLHAAAGRHGADDER